MKVAVVQTKPRKGDLRANVATARAVLTQLAAEAEPYDLIVFPEAAFTGYFLEGGVYDLARSASEIAAEIASLWQAAAPQTSVDIVFGFYENAGGTYYNAALYLEVNADAHRVVHVHRKMFLPTYGVFDEERFLSRGRRLRAFDTRFGRVAMLICEDAWHAVMPTLAAIDGARLLLIPSASPGRGFTVGPELESIVTWRQLLRATAIEHGVFAIYAGLAGFEGGKGMTGSSCIVDPHGATIVRAPALGPAILRASLDLREVDLARASLPLLGDLQSVLPDLLASFQAVSERRA